MNRKRKHVPGEPRAEVDALMKRCQIGCGGRHALDNAHSILAECYGTLGALMLEVERLRTSTAVATEMAAQYGADRDMLRDALAALAAAVSDWPCELGQKTWHALEDARQALAQAGGPNV